MTLDEKTGLLKRSFPKLEESAYHDTDSQGNLFNELIYPNDHQPNMPITVTLTDGGCFISVGQISIVTGNRPISCEQAAEAIDDIINNRIIFVLGYRDGDDVGFGSPFMTELFALTGGVDDMSKDLDKFIEKIKKPLTPFKRKISMLKGRFIITDFSGGRNQTIFR